MALYTYRCADCAADFDAAVPVERRNDPQPCPHDATHTTSRTLCASWAYKMGSEGLLIGPSAKRDGIGSSAPYGVNTRKVLVNGR